MQKMEKEKGFLESKTHPKTGKKYLFLIWVQKMIGKNSDIEIKKK